MNDFLIASSMKLCRLPKLIVPSHLSMFTSLDLLHVAKATNPSTMTNETWATYATIFQTLRCMEDVNGAWQPGRVLKAKVASALI